MTDETTYYLRRAEVEAIRSIKALDPRAAAAHEGLSRLHANRALAGMTGSAASNPTTRG